jgi:hypothetical protein
MYIYHTSPQSNQLAETLLHGIQSSCRPRDLNIKWYTGAHYQPRGVSPNPEPICHSNAAHLSLKHVAGTPVLSTSIQVWYRNRKNAHRYHRWDSDMQNKTVCRKAELGDETTDDNVFLIQVMIET